VAGAGAIVDYFIPGVGRIEGRSHQHALAHGSSVLQYGPAARLDREYHYMPVGDDGKDRAGLLMAAGRCLDDDFVGIS
jgi:hypothetical protein